VSKDEEGVRLVDGNKEVHEGSCYDEISDKEGSSKVHDIIEADKFS